MKGRKIDIPTPASLPKVRDESKLSEARLRDKIKGAIVGSAIGDAMGAPTEMWDRRSIRKVYGFVSGLHDLGREKSPEGPWANDMKAGATTDDTRWKYLLGQYLIRHKDEVSGKKFAQFITDYYRDLLREIQEMKPLASINKLNQSVDKLQWIQEWAAVAMAYSGEFAQFAVAQNKFYGGEMSCAGMLYAPMFGLVASNAREAYTLAFEHCFFDLGYARDLSALLSVMTYLAFSASSIEQLIEEALKIDPYHFCDSRLIGRMAKDLAVEAQEFVDKGTEAASIEKDEEVGLPPNFTGTGEEWHRLNGVYKRLDGNGKASPFHAGEIWQILLTGLYYGKGDFDMTLQFIVNYGRDNDTVAAIAGMILGAYLGYDCLPVNLKEKVVLVSKEIVGIDLVQLSNDVDQCRRR